MKSHRFALIVALFAVSMFCGCKGAKQESGGPSPSAKAGDASASTPGAGGATSAAKLPPVVPASQLKGFLPPTINSFEPDKGTETVIENGSVSSISCRYSTADPTSIYSALIRFDGTNPKTAEQLRDKAVGKNTKVEIGGFPGFESTQYGLFQLTIFVGKNFVLLSGPKADADAFREAAKKMDLAGLAKVGS